MTYGELTPEFRQEIVDFLYDRIDAFEGQTFWGSDFVSELSMEENNTGAWIMYRDRAEAFVKKYAIDALATIAHQVEELDNKNVSEMIKEPETFTFYMLYYGIDMLVPHLPCVEEVWDDEFEVTPEFIAAFKTQLNGTPEAEEEITGPVKTDDSDEVIVSSDEEEENEFGLPDECDMEIDPEELEDYEDIEDLIADKLSDEYGYCIYGIDDIEEVGDGLYHVSGIDWDTSDEDDDEVSDKNMERAGVDTDWFDDIEDDDFDPEKNVSEKDWERAQGF